MKIRDEVKRLLAQVNTQELTAISSSLREGMPCQFVAGQYLGSGATMGSANYHGWILFDDGVRWVVRLPRTTGFSDFPSDLVDYLVESEYATLKFLEPLNIPAPRAYG